MSAEPDLGRWRFSWEVSDGDRPGREEEMETCHSHIKWIILGGASVNATGIDGKQVFIGQVSSKSVELVLIGRVPDVEQVLTDGTKCRTRELRLASLVLDNARPIVVIILVKSRPTLSRKVIRLKVVKDGSRPESLNSFLENHTITRARVIIHMKPVCSVRT
jgi:hypothetical protein